MTRSPAVDPPRDRALDSTLALLREGYTFLGRRRRRLGSETFETRLMLRRFICITGPDAARLFYDPEKFVRAGVMPEPVRATLIGEGAVQLLDGDAHHRRKALFLSVTHPPSAAALGEAFDAAWDRALERWAGLGRVVLLPAVEEVLTAAVCRWAGVPLSDGEVPARARLLAALIDGAGGPGLRHLRGRIARRRADAWIARHVERARADGGMATDTPLARMASHREPDGQLLDARTAAVELINLLRPTVAIARYVVFAALALHHHPEWRRRLADGTDGDLEAFVHEVRRFYPFFPAVGARVREDFTWQGCRFPADRRVLLDLYGTNRDPRAWSEPNRFRPERFIGWAGDPYTLVPQGGGDHATGHRCAGEWITIEVLGRAIRALVGRTRYRVPPQDLRVSLARIPTGPRSGFVIEGVDRAAFA